MCPKLASSTVRIIYCTVLLPQGGLYFTFKPLDNAVPVVTVLFSVVDLDPKLFAESGRIRPKKSQNEK